MNDLTQRWGTQWSFQAVPSSPPVPNHTFYTVLLVPFSLERNNSQAFSCFQILIAWLTVSAPQAKCRRMCTTYNGKVHYFSTGTELTVFRIESLTQFGWRRWELSWNSSLFEITRVIHEWFHVKSRTFRSGVPMSGKESLYFISIDVRNFPASPENDIDSRLDAHFSFCSPVKWFEDRNSTLRREVKLI